MLYCFRSCSVWSSNWQILQASGWVCFMWFTTSSSVLKTMRQKGHSKLWVFKCSHNRFLNSNVFLHSIHLLLWLFLICPLIPCPLSPDLGFWMMLEVPDWGFASWSWSWNGNWSLIHLCYELWLSTLILKGQRTSMSSKSSFRALEDTAGSWLRFGSWSWFWYDQWSLIYPQSKFWLSLLILKMQRTSMSFKSSFEALGAAGGSWLGFGILILISIWSLVFDTPMIQILALCLDFEGAKNIHVL